MRNGFLNNLPDLELNSRKNDQQKLGISKTVNFRFCKHFWKTYRTVKIFGFTRRYKFCKRCGLHIRTKETVEARQK